MSPLKSALSALFVIQNRALRAEADLETAIRMLEVRGAEMKTWKHQAEHLRAAFLAAAFHRASKASLVRPINPIYYLQNLSIEALNILVEAHARQQVPLPPEIMAELRNRGMR